MPGIDARTRDAYCVRRILEYCDQIGETLESIGRSRTIFLTSHIHRNAVAMCILQIGEISKQFSQEVLSSNSQIPWKLIARTRDLYAHHYGAVDFELLWETAVGDIPEVTRFCRSYLEG